MEIEGRERGWSVSGKGQEVYILAGFCLRALRKLEKGRKSVYIYH